MISPASQAEFALLEYRRDAGFRSYVDKAVSGLISAGAVPPGTAINDIMLMTVEGSTAADVWLKAFHRGTGLSGYERARGLSL